jgi:putative nucleotidyltransferase with HDIG domain
MRGDRRIMAKYKLLFVDDEPMILSLLKQMLGRMKDDWEMSFALSGPEALEILAKQPIDLVVSDFNMPGMDGAALMDLVEEKYPRTVRFLFSGIPPDEGLFRIVRTTHRFLRKPDDLKGIRQAIRTALMVRDIIGDEGILSVISKMKAMPASSEVYLELVRELRSPDCAVERVGRLIQQDLAMSAKFLHLVNSAFFGAREHVHSPAHAATLLGLETIKSLVFMVNVFSQHESLKVKGFSVQQLWQHCVTVGMKSRAIAVSEGLPDDTVDQFFMGGFFHDIGKLMLASSFPEEYARILACGRKDRNWLVDEERRAFEATHAEVGAYLLGTWGFSEDVIDAVAFHHEPARSPRKAFCALTGVLVANALAPQVGHVDTGTPLQEDYVELIGKHTRLAAWKDVVHDA